MTTNQAADYRTPARRLADLIGADNARAAIEAGAHAINKLNARCPEPLVHPGRVDLVAAIAIVAALPAIGVSAPATTLSSPGRTA